MPRNPLTFLAQRALLGLCSLLAVAPLCAAELQVPPTQKKGPERVLASQNIRSDLVLFGQELALLQRAGQGGGLAF
ncbi:hypothetical protein [Pseudoxanthomonas sp. JBR18]|uniref:hypothetical protein n=1 Tax=Pseudoxanthomonas sp. JBR18 TaxID=2969308 RepID=UPI002305B312|nr:hypothetical protein [Pseudoxanthomonas sp. JBR18]WCE05901.1 hypothetical protein PJ250_08115 [Pseudoxanthomonas sp. JBR18]